MISVLLIAQHDREMQILKTAFEQAKIQVVMSKTDYASYVKVLQYVPDIILIELPRLNMDQLHFAEQIRRHKKTRHIPILAYGNPMDEGVLGGISKHGVSRYFGRPLRFTGLMAVIDGYLKQAKKQRDAIAPVGSDKEEDLKLILDPNTLPTKKIDLFIKHVSKLLAFPFTVSKVMHLVENEKSAAGDLAKVMEADPVISASILKVCNSVLFASVSRRIVSIKDAIVRIGFMETKRIVLGMSVMKLFAQDNKNLGFDRVDFWYHSLTCALISEKIAKTMGGISTEEAFLAGLLHDFGIIILDEFFPTIFSKVLEETTTTGEVFLHRETAMLGVNHNDVMSELFVKWKLPDTVTKGITQQYSFSKGLKDIDQPENKLAICVALGDLLAKTLGLGRECDEFVGTIGNEIFSAIKMPTGFSKIFIDSIYTELGLYRQFLGLEQRDYIKQETEAQGAPDKRIGIYNPTGGIFVPPQVFLQRAGYKVQVMKQSESLSVFDSQFDIIVAWMQSESKPQVLSSAMHVVRYSEEQPEASKPPQFTPLLVFVNEQSSLPKDKTLNGVSFAYGQGDLRLIEKNLDDIFGGKVVALPEAELHYENEHKDVKKAQAIESKSHPVSEEIVPASGPIKETAPAKAESKPPAPDVKTETEKPAAANPQAPISSQVEKKDATTQVQPSKDSSPNASKPLKQ